MKPGIYALVALDGAPLRHDDLTILGLATSQPAALQGCAVAVVDRETAATHVAHVPGEVVAFAGYLDEPEDLSASLGVEASLSPALLARKGMDRYGDAAAERMLGAWNLLRWKAAERELTLLGGEVMRDGFYFATDGRYVAVAPDMLLLCRLPWVGRALDPQGFALNVARASLRRITGDRTPWRGVYAVRPGRREVLRASGRISIPPAAPQPPSLFRGSFEDAVEASDSILRRIVGRAMRRSGRNAFMLSGGIDSGLLASLGSRERGPDAEMFCLTSVAPAGSNVPDEWQFSSAVAAELGVDLFRVEPPADAGPFRPSDDYFALFQQPLTVMRHYLYEAFYKKAAQHGAMTLFDGVSGELSITYKPTPGAHLWWLRRWNFRAKRALAERKSAHSWPEGAFHVRLAPDLLRSLPRAWEEAHRIGMYRAAKRVQGRPVGLHQAIYKDLGSGSLLQHGLRAALPYVDRRLLRLAATFPAEMFEMPGETRAIARAMLRGRIPEAVRTRRWGLPFSPDYRERSKRLVQAAKDRLPALHASGSGEWIDLVWLRTEMGKVQAGVDRPAERAQAEITASAAEFVAWLAPQ